MSHFPFDKGVLAELGALTGQKTIKALCGKRVAFASGMATQHIDCPDCRTEIQSNIDSNIHMLKTPNIPPDLIRDIQVEIDFLQAALNL